MTTRTGKESFINPSYELGVMENGSKISSNMKDDNSRSGARRFLPHVQCVAGMYLFFIGLALIGAAMKVISGPVVNDAFNHIKNDPLQGLATGILVTVLVQSSSTTTSITVVLTALEELTVNDAIPVILGANIGTSVTSTLVAMAHMGSKDKQEFPRAFAGAVVSDVFNFLGVVVYLPLHLLTKLFNAESKGFLEVVAQAVVPEQKEKGGKIPNPIKYITRPVVELIIKRNKDVYQTLTEGGAPHLGRTTNFKNKFGIDYNVGTNETKLALATKIYNEKVLGGKVLKGGLLGELSDVAGGVVGLVLAIAILIAALSIIVAALKKITMGSAKQSIEKALNMNSYLAVFIGILATIAVQSSSIITSTLVPLIAVGTLRVRQSLPLCIGSNIGTCATAMIAAASTDNIALGLRIGVIHLLFNILTFVTFFPLEKVRNIPIHIAEAFGRSAAFNKAVPAVYMIYCYMAVPLVVFIVGMYDNLVFLNVFLVVCFIATPIALWWKFVRPGAAKFHGLFVYDGEDTTTPDEDDALNTPYLQLGETA
jgi:sodium-dependent phosphate cotransporter